MKSYLLSLGLLAISSGVVTAADDDKYCLHSVCIGDDLLKLDVQWAPIAIDADARQYYAGEMQRTSAKDLYKAANLKLVSDDKSMVDLMPYLIDRQEFDGTALEALKKVEAFCSPLTIKGELKLDSKDKVFVTAQTVPPTAEGMQLRVVRIEKIFDAYHPISRPEQEAKVKEMTSVLRKLFPGLVQIRDIDDMFINDRYTDKPVLLGFKFTSDVAIPMALKLRDVSDLPALDESSVASVCKV